MAQRKTLTEKQVAVLRWIADGCPDGVMEDEFHRISAAALRSRGLVETSGRGSTWTVTITSAGSEYLAMVDGPNPPIARQANVPVTQQLVDDVIAAGGVLRVPRRGWYDSDGTDYMNRARMAERLGKVPDGKRLTVTTIDSELEIRLEDAPGHTGHRATLAPVVIPDRIGRYHQAAKQFRDLSTRHEVSREQFVRAARIIHLVATEAERRGWSAEAPTGSKNGHRRTDWTGAKNGHLHITADHYQFWLRLREEGVHTRGPWGDEVKHYRNVSRDSYLYRGRELPSGPYDADATGRLKLELHDEAWWIHRGRQSRFADRQSWTLEDRLPHLLREIEERIVDAQRHTEEERIKAEKAAEAAKRQAEEREHQWHLLMAQAKERLIEKHRVTHLRQQANAWEQAERLRRYCDAMQAACGGNRETARWIAWARTYANRLDPLNGSPSMPEAPDATAETLQEHLPAGWSAHGPEHDRRSVGQRGW